MNLLLSIIPKLNINSTKLSTPKVALRRYCYGSSIYKKGEQEQGYQNYRPIQQTKGWMWKPCKDENKPNWPKPIQHTDDWMCTPYKDENKPGPELSHAMMHTPNLDVIQLHAFSKSKKDRQDIENQKYIAERHNILGPDLAALHFFTFRHAAVRLQGHKKWIRESLQDLPKSYVGGYRVEAIDCSTFHQKGIRYEGLKNLVDLEYLKWLSLKNQTHIDAWCLDRIAGQNGRSLEYLDIRSCNLNLGCIMALGRMESLQTLIIKDPGRCPKLQTALMNLEYKLPECLITRTQDHLEPENKLIYL